MILWGFISALLALVLCLSAEGLASRLRVLDTPDGGRKLHARPTPLTGGIAIMVPFIVWLAAISIGGNASFLPLNSALAVGGAGAAIMGFTDDQQPISALSRILFIAVFVTAATAIDPALVATALNWGGAAPTPVPGWLYSAILTLAAVGIVNAVNMADGQNGLVAGLFLVWSVCLMLLSDPAITAIAAMLAALSTIVFLFNLRGVLFLGGCGSYGVAFVFGLLTVAAYAEQRITIQTMAVWFFIPVLDCLRLLVLRLSRGSSPSQPDREHFHHRLQETFGPELCLAIYLGSSAIASLVVVLHPEHGMRLLAVQAMIYLTCFWITSARSRRIAFEDVPVVPPRRDLRGRRLAPVSIDRRLDGANRGAIPQDRSAAAPFAVQSEDA